MLIYTAQSIHDVPRCQTVLRQRLSSGGRLYPQHKTKLDLNLYSTPPPLPIPCSCRLALLMYDATVAQKDALNLGWCKCCLLFMRIRMHL